MREIRLHDTLSGELLPLRPRDPGRVGIYACGPTVYSRIHIGNARPFVVFSLLKRFLAHEGYDVTLVVNVTDVNDKIYDAARPQGRSSAELAAEMTEHYRADTDALGLGRPDHEPLASETIGPIVEYIETLIAGGHAYAVDGDVYFRVRSDPGYGKLSHRQLENMDQGEGVEGTERKEDPLDFALWKAHKPGEDTLWRTPWGTGRPGWHIECSAMAEQFLGVGFDIHGGGSDLVFPHHENEAAQTRAARGEELTKLWMHNGMIQFTGEKMAKSVGNIALLHEVLDGYGAGGGRDVPDLRALPPAARVLRGRAGAGPGERQAHPRGRPAALRGRLARGSGRAARPLLRRARPRLQHGRGTVGAQRVDPRGDRPAHGLAGRRAPARDARRARAGVAARGGRAGARSRAASSPSSASRPAASATSRRPIGCAMRSRRWAGRSATGRTASS